MDSLALPGHPGGGLLHPHPSYELSAAPRLLGECPSTVALPSPFPGRLSSRSSWGLCNPRVAAYVPADKRWS